MSGERIDGFPEITAPQIRCSLCKFASSHPELIHVVHDLYGEQEIKGRPLFRKLEPLFKKAGLRMPTANAFQRHLTRHINTALIDNAWKGPQPEVGEPLDEYESDYRELRRLYKTVKGILVSVEADFNLQRAAKDEDKKLSNYGLVMLLKLAGEARTMLKTLWDMRSSDRLQRNLLVSHTEGLVDLLTQPLGLKLREISTRLREGEDPDEVADDLDELLRSEWVPLFETAARQALAQSHERYNLN